MSSDEIAMVGKQWNVINKLQSELLMAENFMLHPDPEKRSAARDLMQAYKGGDMHWRDLCIEYEKWKGNPISRDHLRKLMFPDG